MDSYISFENVSFSYTHGDNEKDIAVDNISFDIKKGDITAILGRNGSGKSTVAHLMNGLLKPSSGTVTVDGLTTEDDNNIWDIRKRIGMIFQNPDNQIVGTTVLEDVAFGVENIGVQSELIEERVHDALCAVGMDEYASSAPHRLSGGQKQRVSIAGILAMNTDCIVMDESTSMLDPSGRREVLDMVLKLNKEKGITLIFITHYMDEAYLADHIIVMGKGKILIEGTAETVFDDVEKIKDVGMDLPHINSLLKGIKDEGYNIRTNVASVDEAYTVIYKLLEEEKNKND